MRAHWCRRDPVLGVHIYIHVCIYIYTYICIRVNVYMHTYIYACAAGIRCSECVPWRFNFRASCEIACDDLGSPHPP